MFRRLNYPLMLWILCLGPAHAVQVAGVEVPEQMMIAGFDRPLTLNGAGVRNNFFTSVYVGAPYPPLEARLNLFMTLCRDMRKGDSVFLDYVPGRATEVWVNGAEQGEIEGADFTRPCPRSGWRSTGDGAAQEGHGRGR